VGAPEKFFDNNVKHLMKQNEIKYINYYLISVFFFSAIFLFEKHNVGNDSTISEWIINYQGGFTKRGIVGQIVILFSEKFNIHLRKSILIFQILTVGIYYLLLKNFFFNIEFNKLIIFSIFSPVFILYPIAEVEVMARKEYFLFIFYLFYLFIDEDKYKDLYKLIILPLLVLIWEPVIFFFTFWFLIDSLNYKKKLNFKYFVFSAFKYLPALLIGLYIATYPISETNHFIMASYLKENFNENCYMSCALLLSKSSIQDQYNAVFELLSFEVLIRYSLIVIIGFFPIFMMIYFIGLSLSIKIMLISFVSFPIIILFSMMTDWGRVVNMFYTFSILTLLSLYKNKIINFDNFNKSKFDNIFMKNKKIFFILFIVFSFGWNPKTSMTGDIATNPLWKIPYNASKRLFGFDSFRILEDSPISIWHKKYVE
jgi:hypothetical protein